ncbi:MAG: oligosaccharide repeat unit polymerase [Desulfobacterium sp.]|nr:oligosaccharide repeat unit polymerase [Desulfobacterium sp.]
MNLYNTKLLAVAIVFIASFILGMLFVFNTISLAVNKYFLAYLFIMISTIVVYFSTYRGDDGIDLLSPMQFYLPFYILFFSFLLSFPIIWHRGAMNPLVFFVLILSYLGLFIGLNIGNSKRIPKNNTNNTNNNTSTEFINFFTLKNRKVLGYTLYLVGGLSLLILILMRGSAIWGEDIVGKRFQSHFSGAGYLFYLGTLINVGVGILLIDYYTSNKKNIGKIKIYSIVSLAILLGALYGSRAVIFPIMFQVIIYRHLIKKKITLKTLLQSLFILTGMCILVLYSRLLALGYQEWYLPYLIRLNFPLSLKFIAPLVLSLRSPIENLSLLLHIFPAKHDYFYGWLLSSPFLTVLPGKQILGQEYIQILLGNDPRMVGLAAVTLPGSLFCELGWVAVFFGSIFIGISLKYVYALMINNRSMITLLIYGNLLPQYVIWIYGGFMPIIVMVITSYILFLKIISGETHAVKLPNEGALFSIISNKRRF